MAAGPGVTPSGIVTFLFTDVEGSYSLFAYGYAFRDTDPDDALEAMRRGVIVAHDCGNQFFETQFGFWLCGLEAEHYAYDQIDQARPELNASTQ